MWMWELELEGSGGKIRFRLACTKLLLFLLDSGQGKARHPKSPSVSRIRRINTGVTKCLPTFETSASTTRIYYHNLTSHIAHLTPCPTYVGT